MSELGEYSTPRISSEILDCSMPIVLDTYEICSFNCLYCFARFQNSYLRNRPRQQKAVNPKRVIRLFENVLNGIEKTQAERAFGRYIRERRVIQWGGLSDPFDNFEKRYGRALELLEYFDEIGYPLSFSTKGTWWVYNERYRRLFEKNKDKWHVKISIITADEEKARQIERGVPSVKERLDALGELVKLGVPVTLRYRPFIIGASESWKKVFEEAAARGVKIVTVEYFCLEGRASQETRKRYAELSKVLGYDVVDFYKKHSPTGGLMRLNFSIKTPVFVEMRRFAHALGMKFTSSDNAGRLFADQINCCGAPDNWKDWKHEHFGYAVWLAVRNKDGIVKFKDVFKRPVWDRVLWREAPGFNKVDSKFMGKYRDWTLWDYFVKMWNSPKNWKSLRHYGLIPVDIDEDGHVVWKIPEKLREIVNESE